MMKNRKTKDILQLLVLLLVLVVVIQILQMFFFRLDLTSENRYSLSDNTKSLVEKLEKDLYVEVYLAGDLPHEFAKLQKACLEMLDEFSTYSNKTITYSLIDPSGFTNPKKRREFLKQLIERGLKPINLNEKTVDGSLKQKRIVPGIIIHDKEKETSVHLLKSIEGLSSDQSLNHSIEALEFELTSAIRVLQNRSPKQIAFLKGHGELTEYEVADFTASLLQRYEVDRISASQLVNQYNSYAALIIAQPRREFSKKDKYYVDQYIMNGGKVMWLVDEVAVSMDSLISKSSTMAFFQPLGMEDQLFKYGVRINPDLVMDVQAKLIPVQTALPNETAKFTPAPWYYSPLLNAPDTHPITRKLNVIKAEFANSIDFVGDDPNLKKTVLLTSSYYTRLEKVPKLISLDIVDKKMDVRYFSAGPQNIAVLLEGVFPSVFRNRIWKGIDKKTFKGTSEKTKMIVISDGDMIKNKVRGVGENRQIEALGYDRYTRKTYGNRSFLLNCVDYLCDDAGWMDLRSREVKLRMLDRKKIKNNKLQWQLINVLLPLIILLAFALLRFYIRKRKFARSRV